MKGVARVHCFYLPTRRPQLIAYGYGEVVLGNIKFGTVYRQVLKPDRQISLITTLHTTSTGSEREQ